MPTTDKRSFTRYFTLSALLLLAAILLYTLSGFIDAFLGAIIIYVMGRPLQMQLTVKRKWNSSLVAIGILLLSFAVVLIPTIVIINLILPKLNLFFNDTSIVMHMWQQTDMYLKNHFGSNVLTTENISSVRNAAAGYIAGFLSQSLSIVADLAIMAFMAYYLLKNAGKTEDWIMKNIPFEDLNIKLFSKELHDQTFSNVIGAPLLAIIQGLVASLGYWIFGLKDPFFWGMITGFFSFLPIVGSSIIWIPAGLFRLNEGATWQGIAIILFGILVISVIDNVLRFTFQKKFADVHPLVTVFGVIAGVSLFGVPGIIFGPLLISYLIILFKICKEQFSH